MRNKINLTMVLLIFFAHTSAVFAETKLRFWHSMSGDKGKLLEAIVQEFNALPSSKGKANVELQYVGTYPEGMHKIRTAMMGGQVPHLMQAYEIGTQVLIDSKATVPLEEFMIKDKDSLKKQLLPAILRYYEVGGKLHSLPFATSNPIIYYNADALQKAGFAKPPATWAELFKMGKALSDPKARTTGITWPLHSWFFEQFMAQQGALLVNQDNGRSGAATAALYAQPEGVAFLEWWKQMVKEGVFANVGRGWDPAAQNFMAGRSAMLVTSTSDVFTISKTAGFEVATAPLVDRGVKGKPGGTIVGGNSLWIMRANPESEQLLAYEFIKFMASAPVQTKWHKETGYFPIRKDVIESLEKEGFYKKYPAAKTAIDQMIDSAKVPATQGALMGVFPEAREHIETAIEEFLSGQGSAKEALEKASERTDKALSRYNRMQKIHSRK